MMFEFLGMHLDRFRFAIDHLAEISYDITMEFYKDHLVLSSVNSHSRFVFVYNRLVYLFNVIIF